MNNQFRRFLDEDLDEDREPTPAKRVEKPAKRQSALDRRQADKARGKAISNFLRQRERDGRKSGGKP